MNNQHVTIPLWVIQGLAVVGALAVVWILVQMLLAILPWLVAGCVLVVVFCLWNNKRKGRKIT